MNRQRGVKEGAEREAVARLRGPADVWAAMVLVFLMVAVVVVVGCSGSSTGSGATTTAVSSGEGANVVKMVDMSYEPQTLTVKAGDTVTWVNEDSVSHNAVADDESWATDMFGEGGSDSVAFDMPGTYPYVCTAHAAMVGTIVVE